MKVLLGIELLCSKNKKTVAHPFAQMVLVVLGINSVLGSRLKFYNVILVGVSLYILISIVDVFYTEKIRLQIVD